jgi:acetyltransferase
MLDYLTDIDHNDHEALVALAPGSREIIGLARFVRDAATPDTAELAIAVADAWQRRGLAHVLLDELAKRATEVGIGCFTAEILADNTPTLALLHRLGTPDLTHHGSTVTASMDHRSWTSTPDVQLSRSRPRGRRRGH